MMICTHTTIELETRNGAFVCQPEFPGNVTMPVTGSKTS
ncbi:MAG: hypothetical protein K940chlam9_00996 [Chlamydiae bacterium]|nr:hypothetical protein [Chlamydiota bacterium]